MIVLYKNHFVVKLELFLFHMETNLAIESYSYINLGLWNNIVGCALLKNLSVLYQEPG